MSASSAARGPSAPHPGLAGPVRHRRRCGFPTHDSLQRILLREQGRPRRARPKKWTWRRFPPTAGWSARRRRGQVREREGQHRHVKAAGDKTPYESWPKTNRAAGHGEMAWKMCASCEDRWRSGLGHRPRLAGKWHPHPRTAKAPPLGSDGALPTWGSGGRRPPDRGDGGNRTRVQR